MFGITFYVPGGDIAERAMHAAILWAITAAFALASGFLFQWDRAEKPRLWRTPPMVLLALFTLLLLAGIARNGF
jgi:heme A synthase